MSKLYPIKPPTHPITAPVTIVKGIARAVRVVRAVKRAQMDKSLFASKTFWFNLLSGLAQFVEVIPLPAEYTAIIVALINIGLRLVTTEPVKVI